MKASSSALNAEHTEYLLQLEARYRSDPESVDRGWRCVFELLDELSGDRATLDEETGAAAITEIFRTRGHLLASLDPLQLATPPDLTALSPDIAALAPKGGRSAADARVVLLQRLQQLYGGTLAVEMAHVDDRAVREWIARAVEAAPPPDPATLIAALRTLVAAEEFERTMGLRFPGKKRFGAEGAEVLLPTLERLLVDAATAGITDVVIGTMHRGRLNTVATVLRRPLSQLFAEFKGKYPFADERSAAADVPYHLGYETELQIGDKRLAVTLCPNPSHLEAVNAVALGRVRGRADAPGRRRVLGVVLHTDASVIAQGVVAEALQMGGVPGFTTGGTVHIVLNNQIGFTTEAWEARTSRYCTGAWKAVDSLIIHVNGDHVESAIRAIDLAFNFREAQQRDSILDIVCYRRNGHNEVDEPRFTQPAMYRRIAEHAPTGDTYAARLIAAGLTTPATLDALRAEARARLDREFDAVADTVASDGAGDPPARLPRKRAPQAADTATGIAVCDLQRLLKLASTVPSDCILDVRLERVIAQRADKLRSGVSWAVGEALAFASLLVEGTPVRLSGQDVVRGAFSQRHYALTDTVTGCRHLTLNALAPDQARFDAINSPLSEYAVLGFEYGYSLERPEALVVWEAQFGDFANGAQIVIDQFVTSAHEKWRQHSGIVISLPHGLEGQGPEHSSARLERLLLLGARDNIEIAQPSTPANYFHLLRRQMRREIPKPLFLIGAKTLLRLPAAVSPLTALGPGTAFEPVIASIPGGPVRRVLFCSGKIAYELEHERDRRALLGCAIVRLELLYPFPRAALAALIDHWALADFAWAQEEPRNQGSWGYLRERLEQLRGESGGGRPMVVCFSREESSSPAGSFHADHERDQKNLVQRAINWAAAGDKQEAHVERG